MSRAGRCVMWGRKHEDTPFISSGMATLTVNYTCGHSSVSSFVGDEDETTENSTECTDCLESLSSTLARRAIPQ